MYKINNKKSLKFLSQYVRKDIKIKTEDINESDWLQCFIDTAQAAGYKSFDILNDLNNQYLIPLPIQELLRQKNVELDPCGIDVISSGIELSFNEVALETGRRAIGYSVNEHGKVSFNYKSFAEYVMKLYRLVVNRDDPDNLLVYNNKKGFWEDARHPLHRLIIEIAHSAGDNTQDTWTSYVEKAILDIIKRKAVFIESPNFNKNYFPLGNYTLNSITGDLVLHSPNYLATYGSSVNYNADAESPTFKKFLTDLFEDNETIDFVQEYFGYVISTSHKANAFLIGVGRGANGKSTLFDVLAKLVGLENVSSAPLSNFKSEFGLEPLLNMKLNLATESDVDAYQTSKLKILTSGESVSINRKNKLEVTVTLPTKLVFLMNELPLLSDDSFGFERRLLILSFEKTFLPHEQDKNLTKKLNTELEGILCWAIEGLKRLIENNYNFTVSSTMEKAKDKYFGVGNPIQKFVEECVISKPSNAMEGNELINAYKLWMITNEFPFKGTNNPQTFWRAFHEAMDKQLIQFLRGKSNGKTIVRDIALK